MFTIAVGLIINGVFSVSYCKGIFQTYEIAHLVKMKIDSENTFTSTAVIVLEIQL